MRKRIIEFKNASGLYRARVLSEKGTHGSPAGHYACRVLAGPNMIGWVVDVPEELIVAPRKRRR